MGLLCKAGGTIPFKCIPDSSLATGHHAWSPTITGVTEARLPLQVYHNASTSGIRRKSTGLEPAEDTPLCCAAGFPFLSLFVHLEMKALT